MPSIGTSLSLAPEAVEGALTLREGALPHQLFVPRGIQRHSPLLVWLHGSSTGPARVANRQSLPSLLATNRTFADRFPYVALFPCSTCEGDSGSEEAWNPDHWTRLDQLISAVGEQYKTNPRRMVLTGQSVGGRVP